MSKSILSNEKECFICGYTKDIHKHHIFYGTANRKQSEKYGCWVWLCANHHNMSDVGVHCNKAYDQKLKRICQDVLEREYKWSREKVIKTFGRSYL